MAQSGSDEQADEDVLVLAPRGRNADLISEALDRAQCRSVRCQDMPDLCRRLAGPCGAVIICEEAFNRDGLRLLVESLEQQPPWSDVPLLVLTGGGTTTRSSYHIATSLGPRGNTTLLERPVRIITLVSAVRTALRARRRQYEVRGLLQSEKEARALAEAASSAKDHFLATLSHELRTPLNPVLMTVSALLDDPILPPELREDIELVKHNVELEARLIDDLLDLTRIARGKLELRGEPLDLHALLLHAAKACCEDDMRRKGLRLDLQLGAETPVVWGDSARLSQVFWNLIQNAVKFTPSCGTITIHTAWTDDRMLRITVADTGIGLEAAALPRIFDAFEQADQAIGREFGGLGLGLAICKALVGLHGGTISARSEGPNRGSVFEVRLRPMNARHPTPLARVKPTRPLPGALRVLLVEDHDSTARIMAKLLHRMGHRVTIACDLATARQRFEAEQFDIIVSDLGLPDGSGLDLIRDLRALRTVPAIAVSGYGMDEDVRKSQTAGFNAHLVKPIDLAQLSAAIECAIGAGDSRA